MSRRLEWFEIHCDGLGDQAKIDLPITVNHVISHILNVSPWNLRRQGLNLGRKIGCDRNSKKCRVTFLIRRGQGVRVEIAGISDYKFCRIHDVV